MTSWEENSDKLCDVGTAVTLLEPANLDFSFDTVDPVYPTKTGRYTFSPEAVLQRGADCRAWLRARPEKVIAVVSHSGFLRVGVSNCGFGNADYRIFDFDEDGRLVEWSETQMSGGGLGRSMPGYFGVESSPWPKGMKTRKQKKELSNEAVDEEPDIQQAM